MKGGQPPLIDEDEHKQQQVDELDENEFIPIRTGPNAAEFNFGINGGGASSGQQNSLLTGENLAQRIAAHVLNKGVLENQIYQ